MLNRKSKQHYTGGYQMSIEERRRSLWCWVGTGHDKHYLQLYIDKYCGQNNKLMSLNYFTNGNNAGRAIALFETEAQAENASHYINGLHYRNAVLKAVKFHIADTTTNVMTISKQPYAQNNTPLHTCGQTVEVRPVYFESVNFVYIQYESNCERFTAFQYSQLQEVDLICSEMLDIGRMVLARYSYDQLIYRARIQSMESTDKYTVFFIDYGNTEKLSKQEIFEWHPMCNNWPSQAVRCKLENSDRLPHTKFNMIYDFLSHQFLDVTLLAEVRNKSNDLLTVTLKTKSKTDINEVITEKVNLDWLKISCGMVNMLAFISNGDQNDKGFVTIIEAALCPRTDENTTFKFSPNITNDIKSSCGIALHYALKFLLKHNKVEAVETLQKNHIVVTSPYYHILQYGSSGGLSQVCSFLSLALNKIIPVDFAFTGEISATGQIYKIGKLKEKLQAAHHFRKIKFVFVPFQNQEQYLTITNRNEYNFSIYFVNCFDDVAKYVFPELYTV